MQYVFVCDYGRNRSPTGAKVAEEMGKEASIEIKARYIALADERDLGKEIILDLADKVFVMTEVMERAFRTKYAFDKNNVICLDIEDIYDVHGPSGKRVETQLRKELRKKLEKHLQSN